MPRKHPRRRGYFGPLAALTPFTFLGVSKATPLLLYTLGTFLFLRWEIVRISRRFHGPLSATIYRFAHGRLTRFMWEKRGVGIGIYLPADGMRWIVARRELAPLPPNARRLLQKGKKEERQRAAKVRGNDAANKMIALAIFNFRSALKHKWNGRAHLPIFHVKLGTLSHEDNLGNPGRRTSKCCSLSLSLYMGIYRPS